MFGFPTRTIPNHNDLGARRQYCKESPRRPESTSILRLRSLYTNASGSLPLHSLERTGCAPPPMTGRPTDPLLPWEILYQNPMEHSVELVCAIMMIADPPGADNRVASGIFAYETSSHQSLSEGCCASLRSSRRVLHWWKADGGYMRRMHYGPKRFQE